MKFDIRQTYFFTVFLLFVGMILIVPQEAMADKTLRGRLKPVAAVKAQKIVSSEPCDTILCPSDSLIALSGYDKPLYSGVESLFVTNFLPDELCELTISLTYTDVSGRQLHEAVRTLSVAVPPGETRRVQFSSWDKQHTFYYKGGRHPRTANVSPYDIKCKVIQALTVRP